MKDKKNYIPGDPWTTIPDPTILVTALVEREIAHQRDVFDSLIKSHTEIDRTNFGAINERVTREVAATKALTDLQFQLIERQRVESKNDTEKALAAALSAQEKAAGVLATFTADQLKALGASFTTSFDQFRKDIGELKEQNRGTAGEKQGSAATRTAIAAIVGVAVGLLALGSFVFGAHSSNTTTPAPVVVTIPTPAK